MAALKLYRKAAPEAASQPMDRHVLTLPELARELRCSGTHVRNIIGGRIRGLPPLPVLRIGRRILMRRDALTAWLVSLEQREVEAQRLTGFFR